MRSLAGTRRLGLILGVISIPVAVVVVLAVLGSAVKAEPEGVTSAQPVTAAQSIAAKSGSSQEGFVFRFDPVLESFETFTIPTSGAEPHSVVAVSNTTNLDVWFTEPGADQIGRLVYTATNDYAFHEYPVTAGSEPLNLAQDGAFVWFTARRGNYIGRLEIASGEIVSFAVTTTSSEPSGIDVAPDGSVWFTEMAADRIGHLVVTTTSDYDLVEYPIPQFTAMITESVPYGIYVESNDRIWFAETARHQLVRLTPSISEFNNTGTVTGEGLPYNLTRDPGSSRMWFTELLGNHMTLFNPSTLSIGLQYSVPTTDSRPYDLVADSTGRVWFTEKLGGKLGMLVVVTSTGTFEEYPVPLAHAKPAGVSVDPQGKVWLVSSTWRQVYLPMVSKYYPAPPPPFGIQTYWPVDNSNGLQEMADADTEWLRVSLNWSSVEPSDTNPENYRWINYDTWFGNLHTAGIRPVVTIYGNPAWAAQYGAGPIYPEHMDDFLEFVGAAVERYDGDGMDDAPGSPVVNHWEFYNEQDNASVLLAEAGYGYWGHNGAGYADLLRQAWSVIKAANPDAQVLNGGIAYERFEETGEGPYVRQFLDDFLAAGGGQYIDIFNFHYYPVFAHLWTPYGQGVIGKTTYLRNKLAGYGVIKPVACTEIGAHNDTSRGGNDELQSRYVVQAFVRSMAADLRIVNWFALRDITNEGFPYLYGLLDANYIPKPAYSAYSTLTSQLSDVRFERALTMAETGTAAIEGYVFSQGTWSVYVVWTNDDANHSMAIAASAIERVDKYGATDVTLDADDGMADGVVTIEVRPSPVFLRLEP